MNSIDYIFSCRKELVNCARGIVSNNTDLITGCRTIHSLWSDAGIDEDDHYYFFEGIDSETEDFIKGESRLNFSVEYLQKIDSEEAGYIKEIQPLVNTICKELVEKYSI